MTNLFLRRTAVLAAATCAVGVAVAAPATRGPRPQAAPNTTTVRLIGLNDFHGNLEPPAGSSGRVALSDGTTVDAGGAAFLATHVRQLRAEQPQLAGAQRQATTSAPRRWRPRCSTTSRRSSSSTPSAPPRRRSATTSWTRATRSCCGSSSAAATRSTAASSTTRTPGPKFPYLASNITFTKTGLPATLPFTIKSVAGVKIGIIGATLKDLPTIVSPGRHPGPLVRRRGRRDQPVLDAASAARRQGPGRGDPPG